MASTKNPQAKPVNQKRGPTTGNAGNPEKRSSFQSAKSEVNSERSRLADFVMSALGMRGAGMKPTVNPALESVNDNSARTSGISKNSTSDGSRLPSKYKSPKKKG